MNFPEKMKIYFLSVAALAILGGCGIETEVEAPSNGESAEETTETSETQTSHSDDESEEGGNNSDDVAHTVFPLTFNDAMTNFVEETSEENVYITEVRFEQRDGNFVYEVVGWDEHLDYKGELDAETGEFLSFEERASTEQHDYINWQNVIIPKDAMQFALQEVGAGEATGWRLFADGNSGFPIYEIRIENEENQYVNAQDADVITEELLEIREEAN